MVRYADDFVCCFQYEFEAENFYQALIKRLEKFNLNIAPEKSKIIEFDLFATRNAKKQGKNKPDTFDFLGFTHYCGKSRNGKFRVKRKTSRKKFKGALYRMKQWIKANRTTPISILLEQMKSKLIGHYRYYGITDNGPMLYQYWYEVMNPDSGFFSKGEHRVEFAYSAHMACDRNNFILGLEVTPGNVHDSIVFDELYDSVVEQFPKTEVIAIDSAYKTPWICKKVIDDGRMPLHRIRDQQVRKVFSGHTNMFMMNITTV